MAHSPEGLSKRILFVCMFEIGAPMNEKINQTSQALDYQRQNKVVCQPKQKRLAKIEVNDCYIDEHAEDKLEKYHVHEAQTKVCPPGFPADRNLLFVLLHTACY